MTDIKIPLTDYGYKILFTRQDQLAKLIKKSAGNSIERQRELNSAKQELAEIEKILNNAFVHNFDEKNPAKVIIGSSVALENLDTGDKREYRIMTRTTSNPLKGVISNESPLAQKMLGLKLGNTFKFCDNFGKICVFKVRHIE